MKKKYFFTVLLIVSSTLIFAQHNKMLGSEASISFSSVTVDELKFKSSINNDKAFGDTIFYEDFGTGFSTNGWVSRDAGNNGFDWTYTTTNPSGNYTATLTPINSTTGANGFAALFSDFYNTSTPQVPFLNMDSYLTSGAITVSPKKSVLLRWQQSLRYCCNSSTVEMEVGVSTDSINWVTYDAKAGISVNTATTQTVELNISTVAANASTIYLRFYQGTSSHYYWMIDDIAIVEGFKNNIIIGETYSINGSSSNDGFYTQVPQFQTQPLSFTANIMNNGGLTATNVRLQVDIEKVGITQAIYSDSSNFDNLSPFTSKYFKISNSSYQNIDGVGDYTIKYMAKSDSINQLPQSALNEIEFKISDTVFARDYGVPNGSVGFSSFGSSNDTGRIGTKFSLNTNFALSSVSYFIADRADVVGVVIKAQVWRFDSTQSNLNAAFIQLVAENPIPYTITTADRGKWVTIPFLIPTYLQAGQYVAAVEQFSGFLNGFEIYLGRDMVAEELQRNAQFINFIFVNTSGPSWSYILKQPMIRMNGYLVEGLYKNKNSTSNLKIIPNPNNGQFKVEISASNAKFTLNVRNNMGQVVYTEKVAVQNSLTKDINLSNLDKGVYFVSVENEVSKEVKKVVIR